MKSQITEADGVTPRFAKRHAQAITVAYPDTEREAHALLNEFAALRRRGSPPGGAGPRSTWSRCC